MTLTFLALTLACVANAIGDIFMLYGIRYTNWEPGAEAIRQTPDVYLRWGALSGLVTVSAWFLLVPAMATLGWAITLAYCVYVGVTLAFHVSYIFVGLGVKADAGLAGPVSSLIGLLSGVSFLAAAVTSLLWAVHLFASGASWFYLLATPAATIVILQVLLGRLLGRTVPYYIVVAGPLAMIAFFAGFLHYVEAVAPG